MGNIKPKSSYRTRRQQKAALYRRQRQVVRHAVFARDGGQCRACHKPLILSGSLWYMAQVHEIVPRSRGGSPLDQKNMVTLCASCHQDVGMRVGGRKLWIHANDPLAGADGTLEFSSEPRWDWL